MADEWCQGTYIPEHRDKWHFPNGNPPTYRSNWERRAMVWMDNSPSVLKASSEPFAIEYKDLSSEEQPIRRYYPDFYILVKDTTGKLTKYIIEIKPKNQCPKYNPDGSLSLPPKPKKKSTKSMNNWNTMAKTIIMNHCKWTAAMAWCKRNGHVFKVITEDSLF